MKGREKIIKMFTILLIAIFLLCLALFVFFNIYPRWAEDKIVKEQIKFQEKTIEIFKENKTIFDTLVNDLYLREDEIKIDFSSDRIKFIVNGKEEKLDSEEYIFYDKLHSLIQCNRLKLYKNSDGNKIIEIYLYSVDGHDDFIIYNKEREDSVDEFSPGWTYETKWYT